MNPRTLFVNWDRLRGGNCPGISEFYVGHLWNPRWKGEPGECATMNMNADPRILKYKRNHIDEHLIYQSYMSKKPKISFCEFCVFMRFEFWLFLNRKRRYNQGSETVHWAFSPPVLDFRSQLIISKDVNVMFCFMRNPDLHSGWNIRGVVWNEPDHECNIQNVKLRINYWASMYDLSIDSY